MCREHSAAFVFLRKSVAGACTLVCMSGKGDSGPENEHPGAGGTYINASL